MDSRQWAATETSSADGDEKGKRVAHSSADPQPTTATDDDVGNTSGGTMESGSAEHQSITGPEDAHSGALVPSTTTSASSTADANFFQTLVRMAFAALMTLWVVSRALFVEHRIAELPDADSCEEEFSSNSEQAEEEEETMSEKEEARETKKKRRDSASSSSSESSVDKEEADKDKPRLRIDSQLLHTDTMPAAMKKDEDVTETEEAIEIGKTISEPESPPILVETIGVRKDHLREQLASSGHAPPPEASPFLFFPMGPDIASEQEEGEDEGQEEEEPDEPGGPSFGRLDAIVEEDSDELRSAESSRASTARVQSRQSRPGPGVSPPAEPHPQQQQPEQPRPPHSLPFHILFQRQHSGSSQSSVAKVVELSTPEGEEEGETPTPKVPRLDLGGVSPEASEEAEERTARDDDSSPSDTDTVLIVEEEEEKPAEKEMKATTAEEKNQKPMEMFTTSLLHQHPADADRDQGEVFASLADQHIPVPTPMEEGRLSSPSMSIGLDRSRDSLDHSICSNPTRDETLVGTTAVPVATAAGLLTAQTIAQQEAAAGIHKGQLQPVDGTGGGAETVHSGRKQSEKASSTSSSAFGVEEEEEEPMPLPPPPPPTIHLSADTDKVANGKAAAASQELSSPPQEKAPPPPPSASTAAAAAPKSVTPLWGRNERLVSYLHGYGTLPSGGPKGQEGEGKENGVPVPPPAAQNGLPKWDSQKRVDSMAAGGWTVHPIALKERPPRSPSGRARHDATAARERTIPIRRPDEGLYWERSGEWASSRSSVHWPTGRDWAPMSSSELPPLPPISSSQQQLPPLYGTSSAKPSPSLPLAGSALFGGPLDDSRDSSFMSSGDHQRSTARTIGNGHIRDIPIQRSASAFAPTVGGMTAPQSSRPGAYTAGTGPGHEYYRREVLTRTLVTRSSEALSAPPPLSRSSPLGPPPPLPPLDIGGPPPPGPRDEVSEEYWIRYSRNIEEEERRIRADQEKRRRDEEERRRRVEEQRRRWEQQELDLLERMRREREKLEKELEAQMLDKIQAERDRVAKDRQDREAAERRRREEWERIERERRAYEEAELEKRRELERLERERLERERLEAERLERERLERQRLELERLEQQRLEQERIERERIEIERLEIERIERIKREQREKEEREKERQRQEAERLQKEREELERLERERLEIERQAKELLERERMEEAERERERERERREEAKRREEERIARERLERAEREAMEREMARRARERAEQERLDALRREQERLQQEELEAAQRERERLEQERRERELFEAAIRARERREQERREEEERERKRQEEERLEHERRQRERIEAQQRERERQLQEQQERDRLAQLEAAAADRRAQRAMEEQRQRERLELERRAEELKELERREQERRERERERFRTEEERRLAELRDLEQRNAEARERERQEASEREERRRRERWRSQELLEQLARERDEKAAWEAEKRQLLAEHMAQERKRQALTSKETLERLTRKPYYSRENLTQLGSASGQPDVTTKVERQVIERVDRRLWTDTELRPASGAPYYGGTDGNNGFLLDGPGGDEPGRERLYQSRAGEDANDWLRRGGSTRTSKYRQRMERARREFLAGTGPDPANYDPTTDRFRKSTEDLFGRRPVEYRGPLLQKFNSGEFTSHPPEPMGTGLASGLGRSPYEQASPYSPARQSRRDVTEQELEGASHVRSKSADYLTDPRRPQEERVPIIPENDLQKSLVGGLGEHEMRFRKSTERMHVPDWYRDYGQHSGGAGGSGLGPVGPPSATTSGVFSAGTASGPSYGASANRPWSYLPAPEGPSPLGGISFPAGMFDKYKDEIEDMRRSRGSLHQLGQPEHTKAASEEPTVAEKTTVTREYTREAFSKTEVQTLSPTGMAQQQPGYTVSTVPTEWKLAPKERQNSRVVEVADTFVERPNVDAPLASRYGGRVTLEEALDALFQSTQPVPEPPPADPSHPETQAQLRNTDGPGIFTPNQALMDRLAEQPHMAEQLLGNEPLYIRCAHCQLVRPLADARGHFCSCRHCYTYYCCRSCRQKDWERHRDRCSFARINSLCKEVIMKVRRDPETQFHMSRVAREGYRREGRGSVNIRLISAYSAQLYLDQGWRVFAQHDPNQLLFYYPIKALREQRKEPSLIQLCNKYNPYEKFILSVSIIADIEQCPETPPPVEPRTQQFADSAPQAGRPSEAQQLLYGTAVPTNV